MIASTASRIDLFGELVQDTTTAGRVTASDHRLTRGAGQPSSSGT